MTLQANAPSLTPNDGGPAFPQSWWNSAHDKPATTGGMTLRDYFAAKAMQGFLAAPDTGWPRQELAEQCYAMADAMLRARLAPADISR